jgi:hypothetical protein
MRKVEKKISCCYSFELKEDHRTMRPMTAMTAMMAAYQWSVRNFFKEAMDLSDRRILRRVARGPEGST